jgi:peptide/nickel transport system substrate-binding protein
MYEMLVGVDKDFNPTPQIAESWETSPDGLVWTYHIRHGMLWHDNVSVTAEDVNWTYNLIISDPVAGALSSDYLRNVTDCRALDAYTLQITTEVPKATMLSIVIPIMPKHLWMNVPSNKLTSTDVFDTAYFPNGPIGSGPWRLVDYVTDDFAKFQKFPYYYGRSINFDELIYKIFLSPQAMLNAIYAGSIDLACYVPADSWQTTLDKPNIDGQAVRDIVLSELGLNVCPPSLRVGGASTNYELLNLSVRQAIAMSTNKTKIVEDVYLGLAEPGAVIVPPASIRWHYNVTPAETYMFDIAAANALLNASGYAADSDSNGIRENETSGKELQFDFYYIVDNIEDEAMAYMIESWLAQVGISAAPNGVSESTLISLWIGMKYDMFIWGWGGDADPSFMLSVMTTGQIPKSHNDWAAWSDCFYSNPYYDNLFIQQQNTINITERQQIVYEMQRIVYRDSPYVVLDHAFGLYAYRTDRFTNWPDMTAHPGMSPMTGLTGGPYLFFEIVPISGNLPPQNVAAGEDTNVALNETRSMTGYAEDENTATLNWTWEFAKPLGGLDVLYGQTVSYKFAEEGTYTVTLTVTDDGGLQGQDQITVLSQFISNAGWLAGYVKDSSDAPIVAATVTAGSTSSTADSSGYYNMTLAAGTYDVTADAAGFQADSQSAVVAANLTTMLNFTLISSSGTLKGHVYDADSGDPISGAFISVRMGESSKWTQSNETGAYQILVLEAGTHSVNASKAGYETRSTTTTITVGQQTVLDISLKPVHEEKGLSTALLAAIAGIVIVVVIVAVALMLMNRRKGAGEKPPPPPKT